MRLIASPLRQRFLQCLLGGLVEVLADTRAISCLFVMLSKSSTTDRAFAVAGRDELRRGVGRQQERNRQ